MQCGLLGEKLGHSYSPLIHSFLGDYAYTLFEMPEDSVPAFLSRGDFTGLNVTIPYKKLVVPCCASLSERAKRIGAVNTIVRRSDGRLIGHNTDYFGFLSMLRHAGVSPAGKKCVVLGSGGASATVCAVLEDLGGQVTVISRTGADNYQNLDRHADATLLVNTTPVGMYPRNGSAPCSLDIFPHLEAVLDLIFNPARTALLLQAEARGIVAENGLYMLVAQAKESAEWFTGSQIPDSKIDEIYRRIRRETENLILIGMPGCGKSTIAMLLAEATGREAVDADAWITAHAGIRIPEIFAREGEAGFRRRETEALAELGKRSGIVIATGGGCVTREENYPLLHQNGVIVRLHRDLSRLPSDGRPISQTTTSEALYAARAPLYAAFSDLDADNNHTPDETVRDILHKWEAYR